MAVDDYTGTVKKTFRPVIRVDIFNNNSIKFERDKIWRLTSKLKAIIFMTILLVLATLTCIFISKIFNNKTNEIIYQETLYKQLSRKVPYNYDLDVLELNGEREILQDLKTKFVPTLNIFTPSFRNRRSSPDVTTNEPLNTGRGSTGYGDNTTVEDIQWIVVSGDGIRHEINKGNVLETRNDIDQEVTNHLTDFTSFWNDTRDRNSIRRTQAQIMLSYMDTSVDPCHNFYQYACGKWTSKNPIPKDKAVFDMFEMLRESLDVVLRDLLQENNENETSSAIKKVKSFYNSCMNEDILEERQNKPLLELINNLGGWPTIDPDWNSTNFDWIELMAKLRLHNNDIILSQWVAPDIKNSSEYIIHFDQTSFGLPSRDYFLQANNRKFVTAYKQYIIHTATLMGANETNATIDAEDLIQFETELAQATSSQEERRNISNLYNKLTVSELAKLVPNINWKKYLEIVLSRQVEGTEQIVVFAMNYINSLVQLLAKTNPKTLSNYLMWRFIRHRVNNLDRKFQEVKQNFYHVLIGRETVPPRWKNCVAQANLHMGMAVGALFVRRYFDETSKNDTIDMTTEIMQSFRSMLRSTEWIDVVTKQLAEEKVEHMMLRIGYPDFILNETELDIRYDNVEINPSLYFENMLNILQHLTRLEHERLGTLVNKTMWNTAPTVVNAYYSRNKNQILCPAGMLQPPFYHRHFPKALNYGGIGVVIGHEITHGFDDKGRLFDQHGNLNIWWKNEAIEGFHNRAQCLIDQYGSYTVSEVDMQIDGFNTQGENIADNGGIKQAFKAYETWLSYNVGADETLPDLPVDNLQLFFLNFAQVWCGTMRPEALRNKLKTAAHSPGNYRVIGTLSNFKEFARVYNCPVGSPMNPADKCSVW